MGVDHVEVALVDRLVDRFAHRAAGVVQPGRRVRQLDEVLEVRERAVAPPAVHVVHEGRSVGRREDHVVLPDEHGALGIARVLDEASRRRLGDDRLQEPRLEAHALSLNVGAGLAPQRERGRIAAKLDADVAEDSVGRAIDEIQPFLAQQVVEGNPAPRSGDRRGRGRGTAVSAGAGAGAAPGAGGRGGGGGPRHAGSVMPGWTSADTLGWTLADPVCGMDKAPGESLRAPRQCCGPIRLCPGRETGVS